PLRSVGRRRTGTSSPRNPRSERAPRGLLRARRPARRRRERLRAHAIPACRPARRKIPFVDREVRAPPAAPGASRKTPATEPRGYLRKLPASYWRLSGWRLPRCVLPAPHARRVVVRDRRLSATFWDSRWSRPERDSNSKQRKQHRKGGTFVVRSRYGQEAASATSK